MACPQYLEERCQRWICDVRAKAFHSRLQTALELTKVDEAKLFSLIKK
jgi:hypothetical protein